MQFLLWVNEKIPMDIMEINRRDYSVSSDHFWNYLNLIWLVKKPTSRFSEKLIISFFICRLPNEIVADEVFFTSHKLKKWAKNLDTSETTTRLHYPNSNRCGRRVDQVTEADWFCNVMTIKLIYYKHCWGAKIYWLRI